MFLGICVALKLTIYDGDATDAYAHASSSGTPTYLQRDETYEDWWNETAKERDKPRINRKYVLLIQHCLQGNLVLGKLWMQFIDNILINKLGFTTTTHDRCIYKNVIDGNPVFLLRQVDGFCLGTAGAEQSAKDLFNRIGLEMRFDSEKEKGIVPFQYLGVVDDYNGVEIRQTEHYIEMTCENYIQRLLGSHGWETPSKKFSEDAIEPDLLSPTASAIASLNALESAYDNKSCKILPPLLHQEDI